MTRPYIAGNWKMNLDRRSASDLAAAVREHVSGRQDVDVALFPPAVYLEEVARIVAGSPVRVGGQDCCEHDEGAYTGEVSAAMLKDVGADIVLIGHSERRHVFGESDELVGRKVTSALAHGLEVVLCIGETIAEREAGETEAVCGRQLSAGLSEVLPEALSAVSVAYEPVWAIGTGHTATPAQAQEMHAYTRGLIAGLANDELAATMRILYGGSVKPGNARDLLGQPDIDGALVGGASLTPDAFLPIIDGAS